MSVKPLEGFKSLETHHCVTGSMLDVYHYHNHPVSEDMLLGLGEGVSFIYWHQKGTPPFIGGRGTPKPSLEEVAGQRTGVTITPRTTTSLRKARQTLLALLDANEPVMLQVDMGFLPYFDFDGQEYHFGGHAVVACGYNPDTDEVLIADRDAILHPVPMADLEKARASRFQPFPPKNRWYTFDFTAKRLPTAAEIRQAIAAAAALMLKPPISNIGVKGIRKAAKLIPQWGNLMDAEALHWAMFNAYIFISPIGGSGGGAFRYMFSRFLAEAAEITGETALHNSAAEFKRIGDDWETLANRFRDTCELPDAAARLAETAAPLNALANREEAAWQTLHTIVA